MDADLKAKWIAALRSGEYPQTTFSLCNDDGYCCLGVLANICGADLNDELLGEHAEDDMASNSHQTINHHLDLSTRTKLVDLNDDGGLTFPQIADWIEFNL